MTRERKRSGQILFQMPLNKNHCRRFLIRRRQWSEPIRAHSGSKVEKYIVFGTKVEARKAFGSCCGEEGGGGIYERQGNGEM